MAKPSGREHSKCGGPDAESAVYLYCLARPRVAAGLRNHLGVDGRNPVSAWIIRDVAAVTSQVRREEFCGPEAETRLRQLGWLAPRACRHQAVAEQAMRLSPILPARLGTLFSSRESLEHFIQEHRAEIRRALDRVAGKQEWAVKGLLDRKKAAAHLLLTMPGGGGETLAGSSAGARYLREQRRLSHAAEALNAWLKQSCDDLVESLACLAVDICGRPLWPPLAADQEREMVLNCALLVRPRSLPGLRARIGRANAKHAGPGLCFELSGPWPPYSFSSFLWNSETT